MTNIVPFVNAGHILSFFHVPCYRLYNSRFDHSFFSDPLGKYLMLCSDHYVFAIASNFRFEDTGCHWQRSGIKLPLASLRYPLLLTPFATENSQFRSSVQEKDNKLCYVTPFATENSQFRSHVQEKT